MDYSAIKFITLTISRKLSLSNLFDRLLEDKKTNGIDKSTEDFS